MLARDGQLAERTMAGAQTTRARGTLAVRSVSVTLHGVARLVHVRAVTEAALLASRSGSVCPATRRRPRQNGPFTPHNCRNLRQ
jgi:hypothetical protein